MWGWARVGRVGAVLTTRPVRRRPAAPLVSLLLVLLTALALPVASAQAAPELVTVGLDGAAANASSEFPWHQALSRDGDRVVFASQASNLVEDDTYAKDVFVRDRSTGETVRVSARADGGEPNGISWAPAISGDGRWVVFTTSADDLPGISSGTGLYDLVARDLSKGPEEPGAYRVVALDYAAGASEPAVSFDGSVVAFDTRRDLAAGDSDDMSDVYVRDFSADPGAALELVSTAVPTKHADTPQINAAGTTVAFLTEHPIAGASDTNNAPDVYLKHRASGTYTRGTLGATGAEPQYGVWIGYAFSADGKHVAFSAATPEVEGDTNGNWDVFVRDVTTGSVVRASVGGTNRQAYVAADNPTLSDDGQVVGMQSTGTGLVPGREGPVVRLRATARTIAPAEGEHWATVNGAGDLFGFERTRRSGGDLVTDLYVEAIPARTDTVAPTLTVPSSMSVAARTIRGARVTFTERASDTGGSGLVGSDCSPASGSYFEIGTTTVHCVAADGDGNETAKSFEIEVADVRAPRIAAPEQQTLVAPTGGKAEWAGGIVALDDVDPYVEPTCSPAPGAELPIGTTEITCTATDAAGNKGTVTFPVIVNGRPTVDEAVASDVTVAETARRATVQVTLPEAVTADTELDVVTVDGTAKAPSDFEKKDEETTLVEAGSRTATSTIWLRDDDRAEDTEAFALRFTGSAGGKAVTATATVTVLDGDAPHTDRRRVATGPVVYVNDEGDLLMALDPGETEPRVLATTRTGRFQDPQVSPDGTQVAYSDGSRIWVRPLEGGRAVMYGAGVEASLQRPVWRPDGEALAFMSVGWGDAGVVWIQPMDLDRQPEMFVLPADSGGRLSWNPEGTQLAYTYRENTSGWGVSDIAIVDADTGETVRRYETPNRDEEAEWSQDGKFLVFSTASRRLDIPDTLYRPQRIAKLDVASGEVTPLSEEVNHGRVTGSSNYGPASISPDGKEVVFFDLDNDRDPDNPDPDSHQHYSLSVVPTDGSLVERDLHDFTQEWRDGSRYVPNGSYLDWAPEAADGATDEGRILFTREAAGSTRLLSAKPTGDDVRVVAETGTQNASPAVAADGTWAAFRSNRDHAEGEIYVSTPGGRAVERLTTNAVADGDPAVSPDGSLVAFVRGTGTARSIWLHDRDRGTEAQLVAPGTAGVANPAFAPTGDTLAYVAAPDSADPQLRAVGTNGAGDRPLTAGQSPAFSPDGEHLAFTRAVDGVPQVFVGDADAAGAERVTSETQGATDPTWGDDRSIAYGTSAGIARALLDGTRAQLVTTPASGAVDAQPAWAKPYAKPTLRAGDVRVTEGTGIGASAVFALELARPVDEDVTVSAQTVDGTAKQPKDYTARGPVTVTIPAGQTSIGFAVQVAGDAIDEPEETFDVTLSAATDATIARATGTATVVDDDAPPVLSVADVTQDEGDLGTTDAVFTLTLSSESGWTVSAHAQSAHGTTDDDDLTATSVDVTWAPGETVKTVRVPVHGDTQEEPDETYALGISAQSHVTGPASAPRGTIVNDDTTGKAPETGITGDPAALVATSTPTFTFIGSVPRGLFECRVDGGEWSRCATPHRIRAVRDGAHTFEVRALDGTLVDPTPAQHAFTVDTLAPSTTIVTGPRRVTADPAPVFTMATDDPTARIECRVDDDAWATCGNRFQAPRLADGEHTFTARAVDPAGNADATPAALAFRVDTTAPETAWGTKLQPAAVTPTSSSASVDLGSGGGTPQVGLDAQGVAQIPVSCSAAAAVPCTGDVTLTETGAAARKQAAQAAATRNAAGDVLARVSYTVPAGTTAQIALRLQDAARFKVERKGLVTAQAVVRSTDGGKAPAVPIVLSADPAAPRLLAAGTRVRLSRGNRTATVRVKCPTKPGAGQKKAACSGQLELRLPPVGGAGKTHVVRRTLTGKAGRIVAVRFTLPAAARKRIAAAKRNTTSATLRATRPQAKSVDLTLVRGASK